MREPGKAHERHALAMEMALVERECRRTIDRRPRSSVLVLTTLPLHPLVVVVHFVLLEDAKRRRGIVEAKFVAASIDRALAIDEFAQEGTSILYREQHSLPVS